MRCALEASIGMLPGIANDGGDPPHPVNVATAHDPAKA
jgi:hypothetical protein